MCGIAGLVQRDGGADLTLSLERMHRAVDHRGPDDRGAWRSPGGHAGFAHTRLSIIDPSPAGHQPMSVADGRFTITFNGEIYNFAELRRSLVQSGVTFRSNSDTEVILRLYEVEGAACVERLRGMFAFAIWDERDRTCFLARDRFGIKPLFYADRSGRFLFASEVRALVASGEVPADVDPQAAYEYFRAGSVPEPLTLIKGVRTLEAGHHMTWREGGVTGQRYWAVTFPDPVTVGDPAPVIREALLDSIRHHFVSDVPVGIFLSGGVDSTLILALARTLRPDELRTFTLGFPGLPQDEGGAARRTAAHFGTVHHEWAADDTTALTMFDEFLAAADQPSIDGFNTFTMCRLARQRDTKVVLSGLGGDELFGGYPSFRGVPQLAAWRRLARFGGPVSAAAAWIAGEVAGPRLRRLGDLIADPPDLESAYAVFRGIYTRREARALTAHYVGDPPLITDPPHQTPSDPTARDTVSRLEITRYMRNQLLRESDVMSMAWGVELRVPFLDAALFETLARVPAAQRLASGKALLLRAVPEIPEWVMNQPKRGFIFPFEHWLATSWGDAFATLDRTCPVPTGTWYRKWSVMAFERWMAAMQALRRAAPHDRAPVREGSRRG